MIIRIIPQGTVDNNIGQDRLAGPKVLDPNYCTQLTLLTHLFHDLCLEVLIVNGNEFCLFWTKAFHPTNTINVVHLTLQQKVQLLASLSMTRFGPSIEPINFPTPNYKF